MYACLHEYTRIHTYTHNTDGFHSRRRPFCFIFCFVFCSLRNRRRTVQDVELGLDVDGFHVRPVLAPGAFMSHK